MGARDDTPIFLHRLGLGSTAAHHRSKRERTSLRWPRTDCDRDEDWADAEEMLGLDGAEAGLWLTDMGGRRGLDWAGVMPMGGRRWPGLSSTSIDAVWLWAPADDIYDALDALVCCSLSLDVSMLACMSPSPVPSPPAPSRKRPRGLWRQHQARAHAPSHAFPWPNG